MGIVGIGPPYVAPGGIVSTLIMVPSKACGSMYSECGLHESDTEDRTLQHSKAWKAMLVTEAGIVIAVRLVALEKAF